MVAGKTVSIDINNCLAARDATDYLYSLLTSPQLTAVDIGAFQLGQQAAVHLISHAENPNLEATRTIVPHKIIERDSCRKIDLQ